jgi:hypothetical protein
MPEYTVRITKTHLELWEPDRCIKRRDLYDCRRQPRESDLTPEAWDLLMFLIDDCQLQPAEEFTLEYVDE